MTTFHVAIHAVSSSEAMSAPRYWFPNASTHSYIQPLAVTMAFPTACKTPSEHDQAHKMRGSRRLKSHVMRVGGDGLRLLYYSYWMFPFGCVFVLVICGKIHSITHCSCNTKHDASSYGTSIW
mmetsp:Transcript_11526/g.20926  ORF Transcript_11526/g.20926 Transcript_11526/m.20926 type:complete len:123 (-) Transcript_11526:612-980(-)